VIFQTNPHLNTLMHLRGKRQMFARNGVQGGGQNRSGPAGEDLIIEVPPGTVVRGPDGELLLDLLEGEHILLTGGRGGKGNTFFKSSINQAPDRFQPGEPGEELEVD